MERKALAILALGTVIFGAVGCTSAETTATPAEQNRYENPIKEPPPEAGGMKGPSGGAPANSGPPPPPPAGAQAGPG